jgi:PAS domain S-box-containing protein
VAWSGVGAGESTVSTDVLDALRLAHGASPDPVLATDLAGTLIFLNPAAQTRWSDAVLGSPAVSLVPEDARGALMAAAAKAASGDSARVEWGERGAGGIRSWFVTALHPVLDGARPVALIWSSTDVTELKRTEERLRRSETLMVDTQGVAHLGTWDWDISLPNATWSDELYRIYGLTPETYTPSYAAYLTMIHPDDRQRVIDATNRVFHEHIPYSHDERIFRPDGTIRHLHTWAHPVLDETGTLRRLVGVCLDITDQKLAEEQIHQLNADLERRVVERTRTIENSMRDLEAFNSMVSHDLRAPLSVIQMSADLLLREPEGLTVRATEKIGRIQRSVMQMTNLVDDLLTLARVAQAPLERSRIDLSALSSSILAELRQTTPARDVAIAIIPGLACVADPGLMRAVMTNLLGNAWKYSSRVPHALIEVGSVTTDGRCEYFVRDNGAGFDPNEAHRLFLPFQRLHRADDFVGTGVGLTIVQRIIERHGGRVRGESLPGEGATFYFDLEPA